MKTINNVTQAINDNQANVDQTVTDNQVNFPAMIARVTAAAAVNSTVETAKELPPVYKSLLSASEAVNARELDRIKSLEFDRANSQLLKIEAIDTGIPYTVKELNALSIALGYSDTFTQLKLEDSIVRVWIMGISENLGVNVPGSVYSTGYILISNGGNLYELAGSINKGLAKFDSDDCKDLLTSTVKKFLSSNKDEIIKSSTDSLALKLQTQKDKSIKARSMFRAT